MRQNDPKNNDEDNNDTVELPDEEFDTTHDEDYEDFTEEGVRVVMDVSSTRGSLSKEEFIDGILPVLKNTVVQ